MFTLDNLYRWCDQYGGGIVIANSLLEAKEKVERALSEERDPNELIIWPCRLDDYFDEENPEVLDVYGCY